VLGLTLALGALVVRRRHRLLAVDSGSEDALTEARKPLEIAETIYDGKLGAGWADWGWGPHDLPTTTGPARVVFSGYGGIILRHEVLQGPFGVLAFRYHAPPGWPEFLQVSLKSSLSVDATLSLLTLDESYVEVAPDGWHEVRVPFKELNPRGEPFDRIVLSARTAVGSDWVLLDKIGFSKGATAAAVGGAPRRNVALAVVCRAATHVISPLIYGSAFESWDSGQTALRIGGNPTSRLNWETGFANAANDWFFENGKGPDLAALIRGATQHGAPTTVTVPLIGWAAKDDSSSGFPASKFPKQRKFDNYRPQAGDGYTPDGKPIAPGPPTETSIAAPPELIGTWVRALRERNKGGPQTSYILDNEPSLWDTTHRDIHPEPLGYDELLDRTLRYATEIRNADPEATIAGPAEWGWMGYQYSGRDRVAGKSARPDRRAHGDVPLIPWYLKKIAEHEQATGSRILDVLDVHFYPAADNIFGGNARVDAAGAALRLRSTRALWDPDYKDESWIDEPIELIPRLKAWVSSNHPGLKLSIGEWNFGAGDHISGGLATAEALGRFGQQGLYSAYMWDGPKPGTPAFWAFRAYRNFDGKGGHFLDESLPTREEEQVSLFASRDTARGHVVAVVVNRDPLHEVAANVALDACGAPASYRAFAYRAGANGLEEAPVTTQDGGLRVTLPPYSFVVLDVLLTPAQ